MPNNSLHPNILDEHLNHLEKQSSQLKLESIQKSYKKLKNGNILFNKKSSITSNNKL